MLSFALSLRFISDLCIVRSDGGWARDVLGGGHQVGPGFEVLFACGQEDYVGAAIIMATDSLLFGVVLVIFAYAKAFGFVF